MRIVSYQVKPVRISPTEAELRIDVTLDEVTTPDIRGRLHGPRCEGVQTIEIDYPIRAGRVWIAEPLFWTSERPYRYVGTLEVWHDGAMQDQVPIVLELRQKI